MSEVKRYEIEADTPYACIYHYGREDGDWVKFEDYAALQHKLETVLAENVDLKAGADKCYDEITSIHNSYGWSVSEDGESETAVIGLESALFVLNENIIDIKTPATDAILNEVRAEAVSQIVKDAEGYEDEFKRDLTASEWRTLVVNYFVASEGLSNSAGVNHD